MNGTIAYNNSSSSNDIHISCDDRVGVYVIEGLKMGFVCLAMITMGGLYAYNYNETANEEARRKLRNRNIAILTLFSHLMYTVVTCFSPLEQYLVDPKDYQLNTTWNQFQIGGAALHGIQGGANLFNYLKFKQYTPQKKINEPQADLTDPEEGRITKMKTKKPKDTWKGRSVKTAHTLCVALSLGGQIMLSTIVLVIFYNSKCR